MAKLDVVYYSPSLQKAQKAILLVPDEVAPPYHVFFLLHGLSDDETAWTRRTSIERYVDGAPLIVVMPDGGRGWYCDAVEGFQYGTALGQELPDLITRWFPTRPGWAVGGLSMGGYGAVRLGLTHPERFISVSSHSGGLGFGHFYGNGDDDFGREFRRVLGTEPQGGPCDLFSLAETAAPRPKIYMDCGVDDFLIESNRAFDEHLKALDWGHVYEEHPGDHNWGYWDEHVKEALAFHKQNLGF